VRIRATPFPCSAGSVGDRLFGRFLDQVDHRPRLRQQRKVGRFDLDGLRSRTFAINRCTAGVIGRLNG
jgi:hypothetical protein